MPIRAYLNGEGFDPETVRLMGLAFEMALVEFAMFQDLRRRHHWVLPTHWYDTPKQLIADLNMQVIRPAETKVLELRGKQSES